MLTRLRDERGAAMILALIVTMVVITLSIVIVNQSIHAANTSGFDRRRTIAVSAAEAGVDDYYHYLNDLSHAGATLSTVNCTRTGSVTTGPNEASWTASLTFYTGSGSTYTETTCPPPTGIVPAAAKISSVGQSPTETLLRNMESFVRLIPQYGGFNQALLATSPTTIGNKVTLNGLEGNDGDVVVTCPSPPCSLTLTNNQNIAGNLYVSGTLSMSNSVSVGGDAWTTGSITMTTGATVGGDATSSQGSISVTAPASVAGAARAAGTVNDKARVGSWAENTILQDPPTWPFPQVTFDSTQRASWTALGYQINQYSDCPSAKTFLKSFTAATPAKDYVVWINSLLPCELSFGTSDGTIYVPGNLAIVTTGSIRFNNNVTFKAVHPNGPRLAETGADAQLFLISTYRTGLICGGSSSPFVPGLYDITTSNNTNFLNVTSSPILAVSMYSPCAVHLSNANAFNGQVMAKTLDIRNQLTINYQPVLIPGAAQVTGFKEDPVYKREVS
jgi:Tfp pilus assembly protein PilX